MAGLAPSLAGLSLKSAARPRASTGADEDDERAAMHKAIFGGDHSDADDGDLPAASAPAPVPAPAPAPGAAGPSTTDWVLQAEEKRAELKRKAEEAIEAAREAKRKKDEVKAAEKEAAVQAKAQAKAAADAAKAAEKAAASEAKAAERQAAAAAKAAAKAEADAQRAAAMEAKAVAKAEASPLLLRRDHVFGTRASGRARGAHTRTHTSYKCVFTPPPTQRRCRRPLSSDALCDVELVLADGYQHCGLF